MFKKILLFFLLLSSVGFVHGAVTNGSFETVLNVATDWNVTDINCAVGHVAGSGCTPASSAFTRFNYGATAPHGNYVFRANMVGGACGGGSGCTFDLNTVQTFDADQNICFQINGVGTDTDSYPRMWVYIGNQLMWTSPDLDTYAGWGQKCLDIGHSGGRISIHGQTQTLAGNITDVFYLDVFTHKTADNLQITNLTPATAFRYTDFNVEVEVRNGRTNEIVINADVNINFNNSASYDMNFDTDRNIYWASYNQAKGTYDYDINAILTNYLDDNISSQIRVLTDLPKYITFTPITNIPSYAFTDENISINLTDTTADLSWRIDSNSAVTESVGYVINNSLDDCTQYKIFTANAYDYANSVWNYDDTLTFGNNPFNSIQKIWDANLERYEHSFDDDVLASDTVYFRLERYIPMYCYNSLTDSVIWDNQFVPSVVDLNGTDIDIFQTSAYADVNSTLTSPKLPSLSSSITNTNYAFQATGKIDTESSSVLKLGTINNLSNSTFTGITVDQNSLYQTVTNNAIVSGYINIRTETSASREINLHNYAVSQRGYFSRPIEILDTDGDFLPLILDNSQPIHYITEGGDFRIQSEYIDPDGDIDRIEISTYISTVAPANRIKKWVFDSDGADDDPIEIDEIVGNLIDLTPSAPNRDVLVTIRLIDFNANYYEIQSQVIKLVQFPYFANDLILGATMTNRQVGKQPEGRVSVRISAPENLRGIKLYLRDANATTIYDGNVQEYYKDIDFTCTGFDCSFDYVFDHWLFRDEQPKKLTISALLTTEDENTSSEKTSKTIVFYVYYKEFETARILETVERRPNHDYRTDEEINVVMQLRDTDYANLRNDLFVYIIPEKCDAQSAGNCTSLTHSYTPDSFLYDAKTGYNYYFFRELFLDINNSLLADVNFLRVTGYIEDTQSRHQINVYPFLTTKCQTYDTSCGIGDVNCFFANLLGSLNHFAYGCQTTTPAIVTTVTNSNKENRLDLDSTYSPLAPTQECTFCVSPDINNVYTDSLKQDLLCASWYKLSESPIDRYDFYVTNEYSDLSKTGDDAQYIRFNVPYSLIMYNDLILMRQAMDKEYGTAPDTIGELIYTGINYLFTGAINPLITVPEELTANGLITNIGFDCNFSRALDPSYIDGMIFFKIKGLDILNKQDLEVSYPALQGVRAEDTLEYLNHLGHNYRRNETDIEIYVSDFVKVIETEIDSPLIIDIDFTEAQIKRQQTSDQNVQFEVTPTKLKFDIISDIVYDSERYVIRLFVPLMFNVILEPVAVDIIGGVTALWENPVKFIITNWFFILIFLILLMFTAVLYRNFKR